MLGQYYNDTVSIGGILLPNQTFAVTEVPKLSFDAGHWGILGMGSRLGTAAFISPGSPVRGDPDKAPASVVWEHLYELGYMAEKLFSICLNDQDAKTGTVLFGGIDEDKYVGELKSVPLLLTGPKKWFTGWAVNLTSVARIDGAHGKPQRLTNESWSIETTVDSGAPIMYLANDVYSAIAAPLNATIHPTENTPYVPCSLRASSSSIEFGFRGRNGQPGPKIAVAYRELVYPFGLPTSIGEVRGDDGTELCYFGVYPSPGPVFLIGAPLLRSAYAVFDVENLELRLAPVKKAMHGQSVNYTQTVTVFILQ